MHDRHFATQTQFEMGLESVGTSISGAQLSLRGTGRAQYGISLESVVSTSRDGDVIEIVEWFESKTERKTPVSNRQSDS